LFPSVGVTASQLPGFLSHSQQDLLDLVVQRLTDGQRWEFGNVAVETVPVTGEPTLNGRGCATVAGMFLNAYLQGV